MTNRLAELLSILGRRPEEICAIAHEHPRIPRSFAGVITTVDAAPSVADYWASMDHNVWFGVQPLRSGITSGRGKAADVTDVVTLYADLDLITASKPGGLTPEQILAVTASLSDLLGTPPSAIVRSGHGIQPYWPIERTPVESGGKLLLERWKDLLIKVADVHQVKLDFGVLELARVMRVPGPPNLKDPDNPAITALVPSPQSALTVPALTEILDLYVPLAASAARRSAESSRHRAALPALSPLTQAPGVCAQVEAQRLHGLAGAARQDPTEPSAHLSTVGTILALVAFWNAGHLGAEAAIEEIREVFVETVSDRQSLTASEDEFQRMVDTAWALQTPDERIDNPFAEVEPGTARQALGCCIPVPSAARSTTGHVQVVSCDIRSCDETGRVEGEPLDALFSDPYYPLFGHIRHFARSRRVNPVALLGAVLLRIGAAVPPYVQLPPLVGGYGSLNTFVCLVGRSGATKGATSRAAEECLEIEMAHTGHGHYLGRGKPYQAKIGSGQGFAGQFAHRRKPEPKTGDPGDLVRDRDSVIFTCNEISDLTAKSGGNSTLLATLCELWVAEDLGSSYIDPTRRLPIEGHTYRAQFLLHAQPTLMGPLLLDAAAGGTPQRFVYLPVQDRWRPKARPAEPPPLPWAMPAHERGPDGRLTLRVCATARNEIDEHQALVAADLADPLDGHLLFCQEKLAALMAFSRGFPAVGETDWAHAGALMAISQATRRGAILALQDERTTSIKAQGRIEGHKESEKSAIVEANAVLRGVERIKAVLSAAPAFTLNKREVQQRCSRKWAADAFDELCTDGTIVWKLVDSDTGRTRTVYALSAP